MDISEYIISTPWDSRAFGLNTFEILSTSKDVLQQIFKDNQPGHYTVKVDPLASKKKLHDYGFYYCDTLIEPYCTQYQFVDFQKEGVYISCSISIDNLMNICHGAFSHGRFHRDFNLDKNLADIRYDLWLRELYDSQNAFGLMHHDEVAGFWGVSKNKILLHALSETYRGKGMAKYFWSVACKELFREYNELISSISASNIPVLNLYSSLGFRFRNPLDVYHVLIK